MKVMSYDTARKNLSQTIQEVCRDHSPVIITHDDIETVVMLSLEDYNSFEETNYLLSSPANAMRLESAKQSLDQGRGIAVDPYSLE